MVSFGFPPQPQNGYPPKRHAQRFVQALHLSTGLETTGKRESDSKAGWSICSNIGVQVAYNMGQLGMIYLLAASTVRLSKNMLQTQRLCVNVQCPNNFAQAQQSTPSKRSVVSKGKGEQSRALITS